MISLTDSPVEMVVDHGGHGVGHPGLLGIHALVQVLVQGLPQGLDYQLGVGDLLPVQLHERQEAALGPQLAVVRHVLKEKCVT